MKYKIVPKTEFASHEKQHAAIVRLYKKHYVADEKLRRKIASKVWRAIKQKRQPLYTVDTIFLIIANGRIQNSEFISFLEGVSSEPVLISTFIAVIENQRLDNWSELKTTDVETVNVNLVEQERAKGIKIFKKWFFEDSHFFILVRQHCPALLNTLSSYALKQLILCNRGAVILLLEKKYKQQLTNMFTATELATLFLVDLPSEQIKINTQIILNHSVQMQPGSLQILFKNMNQPSAQFTAEVQKLRNRLLNCANELLPLFAENPTFFLVFINDIETLFLLLASAEKPIEYLKLMSAKRIDISKWIADRVVLIVAEFAQQTPAETNSCLAVFLQKNYFITNEGLQVNFLTRLRYEVRQLLRNLNRCTLKELHALFNILENPVLFESMEFTKKEIIGYIKQPNLIILFGKLVTLQDGTWLQKLSTLHHYFKEVAKLRHEMNIDVNVHLSETLIKNDLDSLVSDAGLLRVFCVIAQSEHLVQVLQRLNEQKRVALNLFLTAILTEFYFSVKLFAVLDRNSYYLLSDLLKESNLISWINYHELVNSFFVTDSQYVPAMLNNISLNPSLVLKMMVGTKNNSAYCSDLLNLLENEGVAELLFANFPLHHYLDLVNGSSLELIRFFCENQYCSKVAEKIIRITGNYLIEIENVEVINFLLQEPLLARTLTEKISKQQLIEWLESKSICSSLIAVKCLLVFSNSEAVLQLLSDPASLYSLATKNKFFAQCIFSEWSHYSKLNFSLEDMIRLCTAPEGANTIAYLSRLPSLYLNTLLKKQLRIFPPTVQLILKGKFSTLNDSLQTEEEGRLDDRFNRPEPIELFGAADFQKCYQDLCVYSQQKTPSIQYLGLSGHDAVTLKLCYWMLLSDLRAGIPLLIKNILENRLMFAEGTVPLTLLLHDDFYTAVKQEIFENNMAQTFYFLTSLPSEFIRLKDTFNMLAEEHHLAFARIYQRLKQLLINATHYYLRQRIRNFNVCRDEFQQMMYLMGINFPDEVLKIFNNKSYFNIICESFYNDIDVQHIEIKQGVLFHVLLLHSLLTVNNEKIDFLSSVLAFLNLNPLDNAIDYLPLIQCLLPIELVLKANNEQLNGHFLTSKCYCDGLAIHELTSLLTSFPHLINSILVYPHIFKRFNAKELADLLELTDDQQIEKVKQRLGQMKITQAITLDHPLFCPDKKAAVKNGQHSTTSSLLQSFRTRGVTRRSRPSSSLNDEKNSLFNLIQLNPFFAFLENAVISKIISKLSNLPHISKLEWAFQLVELIFEEVSCAKKIAEINDLINDPELVLDLTTLRLIGNDIINSSVIQVTNNLIKVEIENLSGIKLVEEAPTQEQSSVALYPINKNK